MSSELCRDAMSRRVSSWVNGTLQYVLLATLCALTAALMGQLFSYSWV